MAKARAVLKRLKAVKNIRKITRTMELIATARFKKAMDRATQASAVSTPSSPRERDRTDTLFASASFWLGVARGAPGQAFAWQEVFANYTAAVGVDDGHQIVSDDCTGVEGGRRRRSEPPSPPVTRTMSMGQTDGLKKLRSLRKERARMLTVQRERELGASTAPVATKAKRGKKG